MKPRQSPFSRRAVLRGAGVALTLPWLESLLPRGARAQSLAWPTRLVPIFLPTGASDYWKPGLAGAGAGWELSSVLQPLNDLKAKVTVISGLENGSVFNDDGSSSVEPAHGRQPGAWLTCSDADAVADALNVEVANGVSVDQLLAASPNYADMTGIPSLQVSLSTVQGYCDGRPCELSRRVSWRTQTESLEPLVDPKEVFQLLIGAAPMMQDEEAQKRLAARASVLDAVLESAAVVQPKLGAADRLKMDQFLNSVREVEKRLTLPIAPVCEFPPEPSFPEVTSNSYQGNTEAYDKGTHADVMNDLIALALQCDLTRVVSYMLGEEYCHFIYDHVPLRTFTATSSAPADGVCGEYHAAQHAGDFNDHYATISWWNVLKVAELCQKLDGISEGEGTLLDHSVVFLGAAMHGGNHQCAELPALVVGGGGGRLRTDQHLDLGNRPMRDFYYTLMNGVFDMGVSDFGVNRTGAPIAMIPELLL